MKRRGFFNNLCQVTVSATVSIFTLGLWSRSLRSRSIGSALEPPLIRPPGALEEKGFLARCIRCRNCHDACPIGCIKLATAGEPIAVGTPYITASLTACNLCLLCTESCPSGALEVLTDKSQASMGLAVVDERTCVSHNLTGVCGACHTICPLRGKAITQGAHNAPFVHEDQCTGCGLCEEACPVEGIRAIRVLTERRAS